MVLLKKTVENVLVISVTAARTRTAINMKPHAILFTSK
jgi:hypothetical protein